NNLSGRCDFCECNFFDKIPDGNDCYILSNILHDWDDHNCERILKNCYNVMHSDGILIMIESIIPDRNEFSIAKLLDIEVLVMGGGKERTEMEYRDLLNKSGFNLSNIINTEESVSILECIKQ
ncbi:MAG: methyltransferase, partial [Ignavibacteria bacterium]|nr:methyltransferase [Ignavibacteria bacterium]